MWDERGYTYLWLARNLGPGVESGDEWGRGGEVRSDGEESERERERPRWMF